MTNQNPENVSAKVAADVLCKLIEVKDKPLDREKKSKSQKDVKPSKLMIQGGNRNQYFASRLGSSTIAKVPKVVFTTSKL